MDTFIPTQALGYLIVATTGAFLGWLARDSVPERDVRARVTVKRGGQVVEAPAD